MTARFLHSLPARNMLRVIRQNRKMAIVTSILMILSGPLIMVPIIWEIVRESQPNQSYSYMDSFELYMGIGFICLGVAVCMGMFCAICAFTETHKKAQVDMLYSLPLTGSQRFFSDYIGGVCMYILPYIIAAVLGWIAIGIGCPFIHTDDGNTLLRETVSNYAMISSGLFVLMLLYYTLCVLITVCCGTLFESIYANILLNCLIPGTLAGVLGLISEHVDLSFEYLWQIIGFMSPIGGLCYMIYLLDNGSTSVGSYVAWDAIRGTETHSHDMMPNYFRWIVILLLLSAVLLVVAWQLYKRRKAEHVGRPFVYIGAYHVMITLLIVLILCLLDFDVIGPVLLFAAIVYFVCEIIRKRGFKRFWLSIITFVVTVAVTVGVFAVVIKTNCFGREYYVPSAAVVRSVEVESVNRRSYDVDLEFTDREVISQIVDFHKSIVQRKKTDANPCVPINRQLDATFPYRLEYNGNYYYDNDVYTVTSMRDERDYDDDRNHPEPAYGSYAENFRYDLTYYTLTGSVVHRELSLSADELCELRMILLNSKLFQETSAAAVKKMLLQELCTYDANTNEYDFPLTVRITTYNSNGSQTRAMHGSMENLDALSTAYAHDIQNMSAEERLTAPLYCTLGNNSGSFCKIYEGFDETIALLESWEFKKFTVPERYDFVDKENPKNAQAGNQTLLSERIYAPDQWSTDSLKYPNSSVSYNENTYVKGDRDSDCAYKDHIMLCETVAMKDFYPEMYALLEAAQEEYISEEPCYCILVNGVRYIIPPKHNDLAEAVIAKGDLYSQDHLEEYFNAHASEFGYVTSGGDDQAMQYDDELNGSTGYSESYDDQEAGPGLQITDGSAA